MKKLSSDDSVGCDHQVIVTAFAWSNCVFHLPLLSGCDETKRFLKTFNHFDLRTHYMRRLFSDRFILVLGALLFLWANFGASCRRKIDEDQETHTDAAINYSGVAFSK